MKSVIFERVGEPDVLELRDLPPPRPGARELLVRVKAAGVNPVDAKLRRGKAGKPEDLPRVAGLDIAGVVESVGPRVTRFQPGDEVFGCVGLLNRNGACAEFTTIDERVAANKPADMTFADAASLPIPAITAWESLYVRADIQAGQSVLIHAGAGGVGAIGIQLAKLREARVVTTASLPEHIEFCKRLGADHVINYLAQDFVEEGKNLTAGRGFPAIVDNVGGETLTRSMEALQVGGQLVTIVERGTVDLFPLFLRSATLHLEFMPAPAMFDSEPDRQGRMLARIAQLVVSGKLKTTVTSVLPLERVKEAHERIETGHTMGKIVIAVE